MAAHPTFREALRFWIKLGFISFGGPAGQIAIMQTELVDRKRWIGQERFLHALNFCMLLPGPEAQQLATYCGWLLHGIRGGITAGVLFVLPSAAILWGLGYVYAAYGEVPWIAAVFHGLKPAVLAIVVAAVLRLGKKALGDGFRWGVAAAAFGLIFFGKVPFPAIVVGAALAGWARERWGGGTSAVAVQGGVDESGQSAGGTARVGWGHAAKVLALGLPLWAAPVLAAGWWQGWGGTLAQEGLFFSKAALVTFGGAYAVLPYVAQQAVGAHAWLSAPQMLDGLGLAETTPGPLVMVLQFVGFMGGWNHPGALSPVVAATLGAALTTWVTFTPCFVWIFLGAPHVERLRGARGISAALGGVTAGVVGVILNLAVWFGWHVVTPGGTWASVDWFAVAVGAGAFAALHRWKMNLIAVIGVCAVAGVVWGWV